MTDVKSDNAAVMATLQSLLSLPREALAQRLPALDEPLHAALRSAVELGKWGDGTALAPAQVEGALQLLILYEHRHLPPAERLFSDLPSGCGRAPGAPSAARGVRQFDPRDA
ncbi:MAG: DUF1315 family protein [Pseudohongiellaceae bacterium]